MNVDLSKLGGGAPQARFNREFEKAVKNMRDPNTPYKEARKVTITLTLHQDEDRETCKCTCEVSSKLAKVRSFDTNFGVGQNLNTGEFVVKEYGAQIPGQMGIEDLDTETAAGQQGKVKNFEGRKLSPAIGG